MERQASDDSLQDPFADDVDLSGVQDPTADEIEEWATLDSEDEDEGQKNDKDKQAKGKETADQKPAQPAPITAPAPSIKPAEQVPVASEAVEPPVKAPVAAVSVATGAIAISKEDGDPAVQPAPAVVEPSPAVVEAPEPADQTAAPAPVEVHAASAPQSSSNKATSIEITPATSPEPSAQGPKRPGSDLAEEDDYFNEDDLEQDEAARKQQQKQGGAWSQWGGGWGLGALGGKLKQVAAGAVRDVRELSESFQQALADVTGADDEEEEAARLSLLDGDVAPKPGGAGGSAGGAPTAAPAPEALPARGFEPMSKGAGSVSDSAGGAGPAAAAAGDQPAPKQADETLEVGLQAIDAQVEQLASGAAKALSSLWGGLSTVARVVAQEVAASVHDVQQSEAVRGVAQIGSRIAHTAERGLETVGRTAMVLLEEVAGSKRVWGEAADQRAADMGRDPSSFQDFFYIYGGEQLAEEVEHLSNECAHLCNKSRAKLEEAQRQALDDMLAQLGPYFHGLEGAGAGAGPDADADAAGRLLLDDSARAAAERIAHMYDPIGYLCQDSQARAQAFQQQLAAAAAGSAPSGEQPGPGDVTLEGSAQQQRAAGASDGEGGDEEEQDGEEGDDEEDGEEGPKAPRNPTLELLSSFRLHCAKRMAEICTAQLQLLINLGASLAAPARTGRLADDGIDWPVSSLQQAALLESEARRMVADLHMVTAAYVQALQAFPVPAAPGVAAPLAEPGAAAAAEGGDAAEAEAGDAAERQAEDVTTTGDAAAQGSEAKEAVAERLPGEAAHELRAVLAAQQGIAVGRVQAGFKGLLYAVALRNIVTVIAQGEVEGQGGERDEEAEESGAGVQEEEEQEPQQPAVAAAGLGKGGKHAGSVAAAAVAPARADVEPRAEAAASPVEEADPVEAAVAQVEKAEQAEAAAKEPGLEAVGEDKND